MAQGQALMQKKDYARAKLAFQNAAQAMPKDAETYYQMGLAALNSGDMRTGILAIKNAVDLNPKHAGAQLKLAELMAQGDEPLAREAEGRLRGLLDTAPVTPELLNTLAYTELRLGKTADAVQTLEKLLAQNPGELASAILLSKVRLANHDVKGAEEILQKVAAASPKAAQPHAILGDFYRVTNRAPDAEKEYRTVLTLDPKNDYALYSLAGMFYSLGRLQEAEATFQRVASFPESPYQFSYALFLVRQNRREEAVREFERLAKPNPDDRTARRMLVAAYELTGRTADAARLLDEALKKNSRNIDALVQRAGLSVSSKKYEDAERDLNTVLQIQPNSPQVHYFLAKLDQARGRALSYRQELSKALELNPMLFQARVELAKSLEGAKDPKGALNVLDAAPAEQRSLEPILVQRNWEFWALGDMAQMRTGIDSGLAEARSPDLVLQDGLWKLRKGDATGARKALEEALRLNPTDLRALEGLRESYTVQKQPAEAIQKVKEYAAQLPKSAPVQQFLGSILMAHGDLQAARAVLATANADDPSFLPAYFSLAQLDVGQRKWDDASTRLQKVRSLHPGDTTASVWLGNIAASKGDNAAAIQYFQQAIAADPSNVAALNNLAYLTSEYANKPDEALQYAQKAAELAPNQPAYADTLGWILFRKGLYSNAVHSLERASSQNGDVVWKYHLAMAYAKTGDMKRGRALLGAALKQNPNVPEAKAATQMLGVAQ